MVSPPHLVPDPLHLPTFPHILLYTLFFLFVDKQNKPERKEKGGGGKHKNHIYTRTQKHKKKPHKTQNQKPQHTIKSLVRQTNKQTKSKNNKQVLKQNNTRQKVYKNLIDSSLCRLSMDGHGAHPQV